MGSELVGSVVVERFEPVPADVFLEVLGLEVVERAVDDEDPSLGGECCVLVEGESGSNSRGSGEVEGDACHEGEFNAAQPVP
ncbi:hypothetical protein ACSHWG_09560 [Leucobacter sp. Z1108]|uniref:hypothetical protein n=1 Tax=Leucobacter sp. Z1108 TaxID=3439066 RepID=UPI003F33C19B